MTTIPNCVPNSIFYLDFSSNDLRYIPGQFQKFGNLKILNILGNEKFAAHIDSFQFLFSLEILDLSFTNLTFLGGESFRDQSNLRRLFLTGAIGHLKVSYELFNHLGNLETLDLGAKTDAIALPNWSFMKLPFLLQLDLSFIIILSLQKYTFSGLSTLKYLNLQCPIITIYLPDEVFKPLLSLEELHVEGLCSTRAPSFHCKAIDERLQYVPSIKRLYIDKNLISHLGKGFLSLKNLEELYLVSSVIDQTCGIRLLKPETFINLMDSPLTKLVVNHCNIDGLLPGWFTYLPKLEQISLSVTTLVYDGFWDAFTIGLKNTSINKVRLSLTSNNIYATISIPFTVADGFNQTRLTSLELTDTRFNSVNDDMITKLPKSLKYLNLTHNYIQHFGVESLIYLEHLETLNLSNQVDFKETYPTKHGQSTLEISYDRFEFKKNERLSLFGKETNHFQQINQLPDKLQIRFHVTRKCFSLPYRLTTLDVSKSRLLCNMVPAFCDKNNSLKILNASVQRERNCFKTQSFWSALKHLANLEEINLNGNQISEIPHGAFSGLYKLKRLSLVDNKLLELSFNVKDLISLEILDVSVNSIQYASNSFTSHIEDVSRKTNLTLYLSINPLVCNCKQFDFVAWLVATQVISNKNKLNCTFENGTRINLGQISHVHYILRSKCMMLEVTISCFVMFWGSNIILGGLAYIWHNSQKLRYLVSFGKRTLNPYHPIEDHDIEMEYDVYISYEGDFYVTRDMTLRDFVIYTILPGLQQRRLNVMIREELDSGRNLYEVITHTVRRSKKVVAFLANGYCQDIWNVFEFNQAVMEGIYTNRQVAIPVLFESLKVEKVKEEIRDFLQMEPVHKYSPELSDRAFIDFLYERIRDTRQFG